MNVLAVDDDQDSRLFVEDLLTQSGHRVLSATDAREAGRVLERERVDVVLLDLMLPGKSGLEFASEITREWGTSDLPFIVISALQDDQTKACARALGCVTYLEKPYAPQDLLHALTELDRGDGDWAPA